MRRFSGGYGGWPEYVPVAERRKRAEREVAKLRKKGRTITPVCIEGRKIASTFWGKAWCDNLERYRDYESRLPRGRTYVRNGSVVHLEIAGLGIRALVHGSEMYEVSVTMKPLPKEKWHALCADCAGGINSLVELLRGAFSASVMERVCRRDTGLFPKPSEIAFSCSCPDYASMCKHVAAVLYGVGARLDAQPELLFALRAVDERELFAVASTAMPLSKKAPAKARVLDDDLAAVFGVEMDTQKDAQRVDEDSLTSTRATSREKTRRTLPAATKKAGKRKPAVKSGSKRKSS